MPKSPQATPTLKTSASRVVFLDHLRTAMIALVMLFHAGLVYESSGVGASFWIVDDPATNNLSGLVNLVLDIFVMPTLFWVAGVFAPLSLAAKGGRIYLASKAKRLLLPWLLAVLTLVPLYKVIFLASRGLPQQSWASYFPLGNGDLGQSWLWFLPVLFLFHGAFCLGSKLGLDYSWLSLRLGIVGASVAGLVYSVSLDLGGLRGWTKLGVVDFQNERLLIYFLAFLVGSLCTKRRVFDQRPPIGWLYHSINALVWLPITAHLVFLLYPFFNPEGVLVAPLADRLILWSAYHLALVALIYSVVLTFWRYLNRPSALAAALGTHSYPIYIVHTVVLGAIALALLGLDLPSLLKYPLLTASTWLGSYCVAAAWGWLSRGSGTLVNVFARDGFRAGRTGE